jgi:5-methylcytosine-specific restriction endonuclease McrA
MRTGGCCEPLSEEVTRLRTHDVESIVTASEADRYRDLKRTHQTLLRDWKRNKGPCIVCGEREGSERDHLPPKVLYPASLRTPNNDFLTFPVCRECNRASSDEDFLLSVVLSWQLNQDAIINGYEPSDPDLLALFQQTNRHLEDPVEGERRVKLLQQFLATDPHTGMPALHRDQIPINQPLTKIVKSIYWLHTGGDILQKYKPGWWIRHGIDTTKKHFIENHLATTYADFHWGNRFIARFNFSHPDAGVGGFIES